MPKIIKFLAQFVAINNYFWMDQIRELCQGLSSSIPNTKSHFGANLAFLIFFADVESLVAHIQRVGKVMNNSIQKVVDPLIRERRTREYLFFSEPVKTFFKYAHRFKF